MADKLNSKVLYPQSDEELREWYEKYYPKGYENLINLFTADNETTVAQEPSSSLEISAKKNRKKKKCDKVPFCVYCRNNDEMPKVYNSHGLHDRNGNVVCPVLFEKVCEFCGATGKAAHTPKYCPKRPIPIWEQVYN